MATGPAPPGGGPSFVAGAVVFHSGGTGPTKVNSGDDSEEVPETASVVAGSVIRPAVQRFRLQGLNGELEGKSFDSSSDRLQVGSHPLNEVEVRDRTVSRFHCEVFVDREGRAWVKDLGSRNGTRVNGVRVREAELQEGMVLRVGQLELAFTPLAERNELPVTALTSFGTLVGSSVPLRAAFAVLEKAAASEVTVLLTGESGTGKSEAAELIHERSGRAEQAVPGRRLRGGPGEPARVRAVRSRAGGVHRRDRSAGSGCSRRRTEARSSSTRSASSLRSCSRSCSASWRRGRSGGSARTGTSRWTSGSSPRPTATSGRR